MAFNIFGSDKGPVTTNTINQTVNVGVEVNPAFHFGPEFLQPLATTLGEINGNLIDRFQPLAEGIQGSIQNANRLAGDLRRTADFSVNPGLGPASSLSPVLVIVLALGGALLLRKLL
ncbi:MAG: hypothetical protein Q7U76_11295 [Nitrospirota bacterium]|nr:hypothetical protein [Nitrospirota bacterium]